MTGTVSLLLWALFFTVTAKYVLFLMRADNKGEGGTLSLMALAQTAFGRRAAPISFWVSLAQRSFRVMRSSHRRFRFCQRLKV